MDFLISEAYAQTGGQAGASNPMFNILLLVGMFVIFYFILIRPQQRRVKEHKNLVASLKKGDEIITNGGLLGKLTDVADMFVTVELAENVEVRLQRSAVATVLPKGSIKNAS
jgi:preprotein translocase subunit YajC